MQLNQEVTTVVLENNLNLDNIIEQTEKKNKKKRIIKKVSKKKSTNSKNKNLNIRYLRKGVERYIHVISQNVKEKNGKPYVAIREKNDSKIVLICRGVEILGDSCLLDNLQNPLPNTNGRVIAYIKTKARLMVFNNKNEKKPDWKNAVIHNCGEIYPANNTF